LWGRTEKAAWQYRRPAGHAGPFGQEASPAAAARSREAAQAVTTTRT